jgi:hypothetical protein
MNREPDHEGMVKPSCSYYSITVTVPSNVTAVTIQAVFKPFLISSNSTPLTNETPQSFSPFTTFRMPFPLTPFHHSLAPTIAFPSAFTFRTRSTLPSAHLIAKLSERGRGSETWQAEPGAAGSDASCNVARLDGKSESSCSWRDLGPWPEPELGFEVGECGR